MISFDIGLDYSGFFHRVSQVVKGDLRLDSTNLIKQIKHPLSSTQGLAFIFDKKFSEISHIND